MKGTYKGICNFTACTSEKPATWYHFSTQRYYCEDCAQMLNQVNRKDAHELYGHDLLVPIPDETKEEAR